MKVSKELFDEACFLISDEYLQSTGRTVAMLNASPRYTAKKIKRLHDPSFECGSILTANIYRDGKLIGRVAEDSHGGSPLMSWDSKASEVVERKAMESLVQEVLLSLPLNERDRFHVGLGGNEPFLSVAAHHEGITNIKKVAAKSILFSVSRNPEGDAKTFGLSVGKNSGNIKNYAGPEKIRDLDAVVRCHVENAHGHNAQFFNFTAFFAGQPEQSYTNSKPIYDVGLFSLTEPEDTFEDASGMGG